MTSRLPSIMTDDDQIIDLSEYLEGGGRPRVFSVSGGEGERSRLALPVWRAIYLLDGERGGIVSSAGGGSLEAVFVLDLGENPPRARFPGAGVQRLEGRSAPAMDVRDGTVTILLSRDETRSWFLVVAGPAVGSTEPDQRGREDLLFLAGECAGLLLHGELGADDGEI